MEDYSFGHCWEVRVETEIVVFRISWKFAKMNIFMHHNFPTFAKFRWKAAFLIKWKEQFCFNSMRGPRSVKKTLKNLIKVVKSSETLASHGASACGRKISAFGADFADNKRATARNYRRAFLPEFQNFFLAGGVGQDCEPPFEGAGLASSLQWDPPPQMGRQSPPRVSLPGILGRRRSPLGNPHGWPTSRTASALPKVLAQLWWVESCGLLGLKL